jgi:hypothetical protein
LFVDDEPADGAEGLSKVEEEKVDKSLFAG